MGVAAEVQSFATDVSSSFAASVSSALGVGASTVEVTCLYRNTDATNLDLLTLEDSCGSSRRLKASALRKRRLQAQGFGVEVEVLGDDAVQSATSDGMDITSQIESAEVIIESDLLPAGVTVGAVVNEILVEVATQAPTPVPTPEPTAAPTAAPENTTAAPTQDDPPPPPPPIRVDLTIEEGSAGSFGLLLIALLIVLRS